MARKTFFALLFVLGIQLVGMGRAEAVILSWDWQFEPDDYTVGPHDPVSIFARIFNEGDVGDPHLTLADIVSISGIGQGPISGDAPIPEVYDHDPSFNVLAELAGLNLAPGESFYFPFDRLVPEGGSVPYGFYGGEGTIVGPDRPDFGSPSRSRNVGINVVPEVGSLSLLGFGLIGLLIGKHRGDSRRQL